jgi:hypothetical protein
VKGVEEDAHLRSGRAYADVTSVVPRSITQDSRSVDDDDDDAHAKRPIWRASGP